MELALKLITEVNYTLMPLLAYQFVVSCIIRPQFNHFDSTSRQSPAKFCNFLLLAMIKKPTF